MVVVSIKIEDLGSHMLEIISELENKLNIKLHLFEKVLLAETGTVEQILSILTNSEIMVKILKQKETYELIEREVIIINKKTGKKLVYARSNIIPSNLPKEIIRQIRRKDVGIGSIIITSELETFRKKLETRRQELRHMVVRNQQDGRTVVFAVQIKLAARAGEAALAEFAL